MGLRRTQKRSNAAVELVRDKSASREAPVSSSASELPEELIATRAYEKWQLRGCPVGQEGSEEDWYAARAELEAERNGWAAPQPSDALRGVSK